MDAIHIEVVYLFYIDFKTIQDKDRQIGVTAQDFPGDGGGRSLSQCRLSDTGLTTQDKLGQAVGIGPRCQILLYPERGIEGLNS